MTDDYARPDLAYEAEERLALERIMRRTLGMASEPAVVMLHSYTSTYIGERPFMYVHLITMYSNITKPVTLDTYWRFASCRFCFIIFIHSLKPSWPLLFQPSLGS